MLNGRLKSRKALGEFSIPFGDFQCLLASSHYENCTPLERKYPYLFRLMVALRTRFELWPREKLLTVPCENRTTFVTFDQNGQNAVSAEFGILAASLPNWRFRTDKDVI